MTGDKSGIMTAESRMRFRKFKKKKSAPKGLTLIELLIVVSLVSMVLVGLIYLYTSGQKYFITQTARAEMLRDTRRVLNWISRDIKEAIQVLSTWDEYTTSTNCLVLQMPSLDEYSVIIDIENDFDYIVYRLMPEDPDRLERIVLPKEGVSSRADSTIPLTEGVDSFVLSSGGVELSSVGDFSQLESIDISLNIIQNRMGRDYQETLNMGVKLRNKPWGD